MMPAHGVRSFQIQNAATSAEPAATGWAALALPAIMRHPLLRGETKWVLTYLWLQAGGRPGPVQCTPAELAAAIGGSESAARRWLATLDEHEGTGHLQLIEPRRNADGSIPKSTGGRRTYYLRDPAELLDVHTGRHDPQKRLFAESGEAPLLEPEAALMVHDAPVLVPEAAHDRAIDAPLLVSEAARDDEPLCGQDETSHHVAAKIGPSDAPLLEPEAAHPPQHPFVQRDQEGQRQENHQSPNKLPLANEFKETKKLKESNEAHQRHGLRLVRTEPTAATTGPAGIGQVMGELAAAWPALDPQAEHERLKARILAAVPGLHAWVAYQVARLVTYDGLPRDEVEAQLESIRLGMARRTIRVPAAVFNSWAGQFAARHGVTLKRTQPQEREPP